MWGWLVSRDDGDYGGGVGRRRQLSAWELEHRTIARDDAVTTRHSILGHADDA